MLFIVIFLTVMAVFHIVVLVCGHWPTLTTRRLLHLGHPLKKRNKERVSRYLSNSEPPKHRLNAYTIAVDHKNLEFTRFIVQLSFFYILIIYHPPSSLQAATWMQTNEKVQHFTCSSRSFNLFIFLETNYVYDTINDPCWPKGETSANSVAQLYSTESGLATTRI